MVSSVQIVLTASWTSFEAAKYFECLIAVEEDSNGRPRFLSFEELETIYEKHVVSAIKKNIRIGSKIKSDGDGAYVKAKKEGGMNMNDQLRLETLNRPTNI